MIKDYDIAFTNKLKAWYSNTIYANTAIVYNVAYQLVDDDPLQGALRFPLISIYRPTGFTLQDKQNFAARKRGIPIKIDDIGHTTTNARFLVVGLPYQIDIYAKTPEELDDITEQVMFSLNLDQKLEVTQHDKKSDTGYIESYDIVYGDGPSELSEFNDGDRVYHYSLLYNIDGARIVNFSSTPDVQVIDGLDSAITVDGHDPGEI